MQIGASFVLDKLQIADLVAVKKMGLAFAEFYIGDYWSDILELELQLKAIREVLDSYDLFCVIHLAHLNSKLISKIDDWTNYVDNISEQIAIIGKLGITNKIVFHGVFGGTENPKNVSKKEITNQKIDAIKEWLEIAEKYKIHLLLENTDEEVSDLTPIFKELPNLGFTLDIGHANLNLTNKKLDDSTEKIQKMLKTHAEKIEHIHIHDNFGGNSEADDKHLPIGLGTIDYDWFFTTLEKRKYTGTITLEIYSPKFQTIYIESSLNALKELTSNLNLKTGFGNV